MHPAHYSFQPKTAHSLILIVRNSLYIRNSLEKNFGIVVIENVRRYRIWMHMKFEIAKWETDRKME